MAAPSTSNNSGSSPAAAGSAPTSQRSGSQGGAGGAKAAVKEGFGKFMGGLNKWADKTADQMAKAAEKIGIKDDELALTAAGGAARPAPQ